FFFTIITCSTSTLPLPGNTRSTRPCLPLSRPVITFTVSFRLMSTLICILNLRLRIVFIRLFSISLTAPQAPEKQSSKTSSRAARALPDQTRVFRAARPCHRSARRHSGQSEYMCRHGGDAPCAGARSRISPPSPSSPGHPALLLSLRRLPHRPGSRSARCVRPAAGSSAAGVLRCCRPHRECFASSLPWFYPLL